MGVPDRCLNLITAVAPRLSQYLPETERSVRNAAGGPRESAGSYTGRWWWTGKVRSRHWTVAWRNCSG